MVNTNRGTGDINVKLAEMSNQVTEIASANAEAEMVLARDGEATLGDRLDKIEIEKASLSTGGNARGLNAIDFQKVRTADDQVAGGDNSFNTGINNKIKVWPERGGDPQEGFTAGQGNRSHDWFANATGHNNFADGKVSHAEGNCTICSGNDSHSEGNRTVAGRKYFSNITTGSEDAGDSLGVLQYVLISDAEGDVTSYFPNPLTDNVTGRYGAGAQKDAKGNIYDATHTPAVWTGDVPTTPNDLKWALHSILILRGPTEPDIEYANIAKATYTAGVGTKVYYKGNMPYASLIGIYGSFAPMVSIGGFRGGNGEHAEGLFTSSFGYGSHAEGQDTRAWADDSHAEGLTTSVTGIAGHAEGRETKATKDYSHAEGYKSQATNIYTHAEGYNTQASGASSHSEGEATKAVGGDSHAEGNATQANGAVSHAEGMQTVAGGDCSHSEGYLSQASAHYAHAEGRETLASGIQAHAEGIKSVASGAHAHAEGENTVAYGANSHAEGLGSVANGAQSAAVGSYAKTIRNHQRSYAVGKNTVDGDNQVTKMQYKTSVMDAGWHVINLLDGCEPGKAYNFETMVLGRQTAGASGTIGDTFAYKFTGCMVFDGAGVCTVLGTPTRTLIGRSTGMAGDGLTTGVRLAWYGLYPATDDVVLRMDSIAGTTFVVNTYTIVQEMGL